MIYLFVGHLAYHVLLKVGWYCLFFLETNCCLHEILKYQEWKLSMIG